jgi:hypothetical protein
VPRTSRIKSTARATEHLSSPQEILDAFKSQLQCSVSEEERADLEQMIARMELQLRQRQPKYIRQREALLATCPFAVFDHFEAAEQAPLKESGWLTIYARSANFSDMPKLGRGRLKPAIGPSVRAELRGNYWLATIDRSVLRKVWADFKFQFLAFDHDLGFAREEPITLLPTSDLFRKSGPSTLSWQACRISHRSKPLKLLIHTCAFHQNKVEVIDFNLTQHTDDDLRLVTRALNFFRYDYQVEVRVVSRSGEDFEFGFPREAEHRGRPVGRRNKISRAISREKFQRELPRVIRAASEQGAVPTRSLIARRLGITDAKSLDRLRQLYSDDRRWSAVVAQALTTE